MIRNAIKKAFGMRALSTTWKNMDNYYKYDFTNKMEFIDHTMRFPVFRAMDLEGNVFDKKYEIGDKETLTKILNMMVTHREMDKVYLSLHRQGRITFYMATLFEEAIGPCIGAGTKPQDTGLLQYREQGFIMWKGYTPREILHAVKGTTKDFNKGKCLVFIYANPERGILPSSALIGSKIGHAAGAGYAYRVNKEDKIIVNFFGEGASSEGDFHAGLNFASTLGSQTLFVCRNNGYAISTPIYDQYAGDGVAPRGIGYGMPAIKVDGCDPLAILYATKQARQMIMDRKGPVMIETYSYRGGDHSTSDSSDAYRTKEVKEKLKPYIDSIGDPIIRLRKYMEKKGWLNNSEEYVTKFGEQVRAECLEIAKEVDATPHPHWKEMLEGVYKENPWHIKEQHQELEEHINKHPECFPLSSFSK